MYVCMYVVVWVIILRASKVAKQVIAFSPVIHVSVCLSVSPRDN